ncbi:hypothetical protein FISHEDRAFT_58666 [Fistulina hepatica ATCC 64428]|uniref:Uncharacterized protein n=1 Tax=Fistulina hepatica ATCC 64428 TaxID=1128425 RepID=A0A0D7ADS1_9AGAR|nr:hypothetical protein FISHEDRAFT_58666 [Fistulina hepatica ATCC 64428]
MSYLPWNRIVLLSIQWAVTNKTASILRGGLTTRIPITAAENRLLHAGANNAADEAGVTEATAANATVSLLPVGSINVIGTSSQIVNISGRNFGGRPARSINIIQGQNMSEVRTPTLASTGVLEGAQVALPVDNTVLIRDGEAAIPQNILRAGDPQAQGGIPGQQVPHNAAFPGPAPAGQAFFGLNAQASGDAFRFQGGIPSPRMSHDVVYPGPAPAGQAQFVPYAQMQGGEFHPGMQGNVLPDQYRARYSVAQSPPPRGLFSGLMNPLVNYGDLPIVSPDASVHATPYEDDRFWQQHVFPGDQTSAARTADTLPSIPSLLSPELGLTRPFDGDHGLLSPSNDNPLLRPPQNAVPFSDGALSISSLRTPSSLARDLRSATDEPSTVSSAGAVGFPTPSARTHVSEEEYQMPRMGTETLSIIRDTQRYESTLPGECTSSTSRIIWAAHGKVMLANLLYLIHARFATAPMVRRRLCTPLTQMQGGRDGGPLPVEQVQDGRATEAGSTHAESVPEIHGSPNEGTSLSYETTATSLSIPSIGAESLIVQGNSEADSNILQANTITREPSQTPAEAHVERTAGFLDIQSLNSDTLVIKVQRMGRTLDEAKKVIHAKFQSSCQIFNKLEIRVVDAVALPEQDSLVIIFDDLLARLDQSHLWTSLEVSSDTEICKLTASQSQLVCPSLSKLENLTWKAPSARLEDLSCLVPAELQRLVVKRSFSGTALARTLRYCKNLERLEVNIGDTALPWGEPCSLPLMGRLVLEMNGTTDGMMKFFQHFHKDSHQLREVDLLVWHPEQHAKISGIRNLPVRWQVLTRFHIRIEAPGISGIISEDIENIRTRMRGGTGEDEPSFRTVKLRRDEDDRAHICEVTLTATAG